MATIRKLATSTLPVGRTVTATLAFFGSVMRPAPLSNPRKSGAFVMRSDKLGGFTVNGRKRGTVTLTPEAAKIVNAALDKASATATVTLIETRGRTPLARVTIKSAPVAATTRKPRQPRAAAPVAATGTDATPAS